MRSKYGAKKVTIDGHRFDSKKEAERYIYLRGLQTDGTIRDLMLQPRFQLLESFKHEGKTIRGITYVADFIYKQDGVYIVEDVKGFKTDVYQLKKKLFLSRYGSEYIFKEV